MQHLQAVHFSVSMCGHAEAAASAGMLERARKYMGMPASPGRLPGMPEVNGALPGHIMRTPPSMGAPLGPRAASGMPQSVPFTYLWQCVPVSGE